ncbi:MAG: sugar phosphate nucleotidyltransferase [Lachnospiraceae bacterium]|nr:sugar phosphate nucleotidyltransferase [Lachnospiraceae bacterium]
MKRPVLVIMAAGLGSRYGGYKQMEPIDDQGHILMEYSIYDALTAGFREVILILKRSQEAVFKETVGKRLSRFVKVHYVAQELQDLPEGFAVPRGREKPWGTGHAVLSCIYTLNEAPFAVINADAYYGKRAFALAYNYLISHLDDSVFHYAMIQYSNSCSTSRGETLPAVCQMANDGKMWAFTDSVLDELQSRFPVFLEQSQKNPMEAEYLLPTVVNELLQEGKADVKVLRTDDRWYGITYRSDQKVVQAAIRDMQKMGLYPNYLWRENKHIRTL